MMADRLEVKNSSESRSENRRQRRGVAREGGRGPSPREGGSSRGPSPREGGRGPSREDRDGAGSREGTPRSRDGKEERPRSRGERDEKARNRDVNARSRDAREERPRSGGRDGTPRSHDSREGEVRSQGGSREGSRTSSTAVSRESTPKPLPKHFYTRADLMKYRLSAFSRERPDYLNQLLEEDLPEIVMEQPIGLQSILDTLYEADVWYKHPRFIRDDHDSRGSSPLTVTQGDGAFKRRGSDLKKEEGDESGGIILGPQRKSFGTGCHVTSALSRNKNDSPKTDEQGGLRRGRIGSGRIAVDRGERERASDYREPREEREPRDLRDTRDSRDTRDPRDLRERDPRDRDMRDPRDRDFRDRDLRDRDMRDPRERDIRERDRRFERHDSGYEQDRFGRGGRSGFDSNDWRGGDRGDYDKDRRYNDGRRGYNMRPHHHSQSSEPEWFTSGPTSQSDTIELVGFDGPERAKDPEPEQAPEEMEEQDTTMEEHRKDVCVSVADRNGSLETNESSSPEHSGHSEDGDRHHRAPPGGPRGEVAGGGQHGASAGGEFDFNDIFSKNIPGLDMTMEPEVMVPAGREMGSRFSQWFQPGSRGSTSHNNSRRSSINEEFSYLNDLLNGSKSPVIPSPPLQGHHRMIPSPIDASKQHLMELLGARGMRMPPHAQVDVYQALQHQQVGVPVTEVEANLKALLLQRGGGSRPHTPTGAQGGPHKHIPHLEGVRGGVITAEQLEASYAPDPPTRQPHIGRPLRSANFTHEGQPQGQVASDSIRLVPESAQGNIVSQGTSVNHQQNVFSDPFTNSSAREPPDPPNQGLVGDNRGQSQGHRGQFDLMGREDTMVRYSNMPAHSDNPAIQGETPHPSHPNSHTSAQFTNLTNTESSVNSNSLVNSDTHRGELAGLPAPLVPLGAEDITRTTHSEFLPDLVVPRGMPGLSFLPDTVLQGGKVKTLAELEGSTPPPSGHHTDMAAFNKLLGMVKGTPPPQAAVSLHQTPDQKRLHDALMAQNSQSHSANLTAQKEALTRRDMIQKFMRDQQREQQQQQFKAQAVAAKLQQQQQVKQHLQQQQQQQIMKQLLSKVSTPQQQVAAAAAIASLVHSKSPIPQSLNLTGPGAQPQVNIQPVSVQSAMSLGLQPPGNPSPRGGPSPMLPAQLSPRAPSPIMFGSQPPMHLTAPSPIHPSPTIPPTPTGAGGGGNTLQVGGQAARVPSPQELIVHTQAIMQNALIKKQLEDQKERFLKRQQEQRAKSPGATGPQQPVPVSQIPLPPGPPPASLPPPASQAGVLHMPQTPLMSTAASVSHTMTSTPHTAKSAMNPAFTPTSVIRKMVSDKKDERDKEDSDSRRGSLKNDNLRIPVPMVSQQNTEQNSASADLQALQKNVDKLVDSLVTNQQPQLGPNNPHQPRPLIGSGMMNIPGQPQFGMMPPTCSGISAPQPNLPERGPLFTGNPNGPQLYTHTGAGRPIVKGQGSALSPPTPMIKSGPNALPSAPPKGDGQTPGAQRPITGTDPHALDAAVRLAEQQRQLQAQLQAMQAAQAAGRYVRGPSMGGPGMQTPGNVGHTGPGMTPTGPGMTPTGPGMTPGSMAANHQAMLLQRMMMANQNTPSAIQQHLQLAALQAQMQQQQQQQRDPRGHTVGPPIRNLYQQPPPPQPGQPGRGIHGGGQYRQGSVYPVSTSASQMTPILGASGGGVLAKFFGADVLKQQQGALPPLPNQGGQRVLTLEELERKQQPVMN